MRQRRAVLLALILGIAVPGTPVLATQPPGRPAPGAPVVLEPVPSSAPTPTAEPVATDEPAPSADPVPTAEPVPSAEPVSSPEPTPTAPPAIEAVQPEAPEPVAAERAASGAGSRGGLDPRGRYIVVLAADADLPTSVRRQKQLGANVERTFRSALRGYVATFTADARRRIAAEPGVVAVVPDEIVELTAQHTPMGIRRIKTPSSEPALLNGVDEGLNADVAIVDTGIDATHPDLNVAGGYNCSTSDRTLWRDRENHGTHVAGTVGARDNGIGVVGVAPGVRLWAVKILNDDGFGFLSWYVCGLDWIAAQRDPADPGRPLFEAVNMSVAKKGSDDRACGSVNNDILHAAICRVVAAGIPVVAAAGNDRSSASTLVPASYNEVITVSALADSDGKAGGTGGALCFSWGTYDQDDTLADFSNSGTDVDLIAPGKCIYSTLPGNRYGYSSGTSMAAPHVTGAVALYQATRPDATVAETKVALQYLATLDWRWWTDRDAYHEKLLDISRLDRLGSFGISLGSPPPTVPETGATFSIPVTVSRSGTFFERVRLSLAVEPGITAAFTGSTSLFGWTATRSSVKVTIPPQTPAGTYTLRITGTNWGRLHTDSTSIVVEGDHPTVRSASLKAASATTLGATSLTARASWAPATDPSSAIARYEFQYRVDGGSWTGTRTVGASTRTVTFPALVGRLYETRVRARDAVGYWSAWAQSPAVRPTLVQNSSSSVRYSGTWSRYLSSYMSGGSSHYGKAAGASASYTFTGRGISLIMPKGPARGAVRIYLDGSLVATESTWASANLNRRVIWSTSFASLGTHTVRIVVFGSAGHPRIDLDTFLVMK